mgnify:CR=1 FL=1
MCRIVRVLEREGSVKTVELYRVLGSLERPRRVKAVFPSDSIDMGMDLLYNTWIKCHSGVVSYVDAVVDSERGVIVVSVLGDFTRVDALDLYYALREFGFHVRFPWSIEKVSFFTITIPVALGVDNR